MSQAKQFEPPQSVAADKAFGLAKAIAGEIPGGSLATELLGWVIREPIQRRREEWERTVGETLTELVNDRGVDVESLRNDPKFLDTVLQASAVAMKTSQEEKRAALRNAILNAGLSGAPDEAQRQMFLNYIDSFTHWHIRLLHLFVDPVAWYKKHEKAWSTSTLGGPRANVLHVAYPELANNRDFYDQVWRELHSAGLVSAESLHGSNSSNGLREGLATPRGEQFVRFISEPLPVREKST